VPSVQVKLIDQVFTPAQKNEVISKLTDAIVSVEGENMGAVTLVVIEEVHSDELSIAGNPITTDSVQAMAAVKS
jgi:4-oxalocrotonate tautomerase